MPNDFGLREFEGTIQRPMSVSKMTNSETMNTILSFYKGAEGKVLDLTYGTGSFWRKKLPGWNLSAIDAEARTPETIQMTWQEFSEGGAARLGITKLDAVAFDPPYVEEGGYGFSSKTNYSQKQNAATVDSMKFGGGEDAALS
mgnify:CR=1 FL=1